MRAGKREVSKGNGLVWERADTSLFDFVCVSECMSQIGAFSCRRASNYFTYYAAMLLIVST